MYYVFMYFNNLCLVVNRNKINALTTYTNVDDDVFLYFINSLCIHSLSHGSWHLFKGHQGTDIQI